MKTFFTKNSMVGFSVKCEVFRDDKNVSLNPTHSPPQVERCGRPAKTDAIAARVLARPLPLPLPERRTGCVPFYKAVNILRQSKSDSQFF